MQVLLFVGCSAYYFYCNRYNCMLQSSIPNTILPLSKENASVASGRDAWFHDGRSELCEMKDET
jgi:hypothetical protein